MKDNNSISLPELARLDYLQLELREIFNMFKREEVLQDSREPFILNDNSVEDTHIKYKLRERGGNSGRS